jgi:uncharacterized spore protein YtfJ
MDKLTPNHRISEIVSNLLGGRHTLSKSETIIGDPLKAGDATLIPVHRLRVAFAAGAARAGASGSGGAGETGGRGAGGTVQIEPVAVIAVGRDGNPRILTVDGDAEGSWRHLLEQVPELLGKAAKMLGERVAPRAAAPAVAEGDRPAGLPEA